MIRVVISTYNRDWYLPGLLAVIAEQVPMRKVCVSDDASTEPAMVAALADAEDHGCHVIRAEEHVYLDVVWNRGIRWAIADGAQFIVIMEDGAAPAAGAIRELVDVLATHPEIWMAYPVLSAGPVFQLPSERIPPVLEPRGQVPPGEDDRLPIKDGFPNCPGDLDPRQMQWARIYSPAEAVCVADQYGKACARRKPRWRTTNRGDGALWAINQRCWETVGLPDEGFRQAWGSNDDYIYRVWQSGGHVVICERAFVLHHRDQFYDLDTKTEWISMGQNRINEKYGGDFPEYAWVKARGDR